MRIGFDAKRATHNFRGLGNYSRGLIEGLLTYSSEQELFLYSPPIKDLRGQNWIDSLLKNSAYHIQLKGPENQLGRQFSFLWRSFFQSQLFIQDKLDIFHGLSHEIPFGLKGKMPFKKIVTMHDLIYLRYPEFFPLIDRMVYNQKFKYACQNSDVVIAICQQTKDDLIEFLGVDEKKIIVHYQSCMPIFYEKCAASKLQELKLKYHLDKPFILNVGAFEERKNQLSLLEAFASISKTVEEDLVLIGQGKIYKEKVKAKVAELKLETRVHLLENVPFFDLPAMYQAARVFCFPSLFEGFGIPIVEALFSGTPVITSFGSCFPESAGPDSYFIDPLSKSSLAEGLLTVLGDHHLQNQMQQKGLEFVQRFHQKEVTRTLVDIYGQALALN